MFVDLDNRFSDLCASYLPLGGALGCAQVWECVAHDTCGTDEHNLIAQALNELFLDTGRDDFPVAYRRRTPTDE